MKILQILKKKHLNNFIVVLKWKINVTLKVQQLIQTFQFFASYFEI